jgi:hypothetical protein
MLQEVEAGSLHHSRRPRHTGSTEEDSRVKNPLKSSNEAAILFTTLVEAKGVQHLGGTAESDCLALLPNGERGQEDRHNTVLAEGDAELRMARNLEEHLPVATCIE